MRTSIRRRIELSGGALVCLVLSVPVRADDVTTLSGTTYREVRLVRVEPDGVTWTHATGACKVNFTDLPEAVRRTYHYDPKRAAAYQTAQTQARQQAAERAREDQREATAWRARRLQEAAAPSAADDKTGTLSYRHQPAGDADVRAVGEGIAAQTAARACLTRDDGTLWDRRLWAVPCALFGRNNLDTSAHPVVDPATSEFRGSVHHGPGGFAVDCSHDNFFRPDYLTKAYNRDVDRAEAFARNRP